MRVKLLFPPHFSVYQPYLSLPALTAFLKEKGIHVEQEDLNLSAFLYFVRPETLRQCADKLEKDIVAYEREETLSERCRQHYELLCRGLLSAELVIPNIKGAVEFLRDRDRFLRFDDYRLHERVVQQAMQIISATYYPTRISLVDFSMNYSPESSREIFEAIGDEEANPYIFYFRDYVANDLANDKPDLVGISLTAMSQVIPALTLSSIIKEQLPSAGIVIGGVIPNHLSEKIKAIPELFSLFDYVIKGEGETPLYELCRCLSCSTSIDEVPNLVYSREGTIYENISRSIEDMNALPTPDYDGFPLREYLSPLPVLSVEPARGCYWRKCSFCNQYSIHGDTFRLRDPHLIAADIKKLKDKHGAILFNISNEGVPLSHLCGISDTILKGGLDVEWYAGAHLRESLPSKVCHLLRSAGCRKLIFGLESGSQRVLDLMNKGISLIDVPQSIQNCTDAGIDIHLYLMIGFPTETIKEIEATRDFVLMVLPNANKQGFTFYISVFQTMLCSPVISQFAGLGYEITPKGEKYDLAYILEYQPGKQQVARFSRYALEKISADMSSVIYSRLPTQTLPEELTHYMCYRISDHRPSEDVVRDYETQESTWDTLLRTRGFIKKASWISLRKTRFVYNQNSKPWHQNIIVYNLLTDKYYLVNEAAAHCLDCFSSPTLVGQLLERLGPNPGFNGRIDLKRYIIRLLKEKLIEIQSAENP